MKGDDLPAGDHVVRYVKPSMIQEDGTPDGSEFRLRSDRPDDSGLSVNWLEVFESDKTHQCKFLPDLTANPTGFDRDS